MAKDINGQLKCTKRFPKAIIEETVLNENEHPIYKRSVTVESPYTMPDPLRRVNNHIDINANWVVSYNPFLFEYKVYEEDPIVTSLALHLSNEQPLECRKSICDDLGHKFRQMFPKVQLYLLTDEAIFYNGQASMDYGFYLIEEKLKGFGRSFDDFILPNVKHD
ncbi:hypothetical protein A0J61_05863 [Choanephora cucurbitarum]|uniref:Uncharacterized protein n=1 Tax=Choanephora cucurbitarum TaxID=101091 RepID=A0A1C7NAC2_9FUNG|nr:hypothetical protein A0J61_05863 [Choanephora cucurbitarum]